MYASTAASFAFLFSLAARENKSRQENCDCGFWVLHFMEEARRKRGEGKCTTRYDLVYRVQLVRGMIAKLKPAEQRAKLALSKKLEKEKAEKEKAAEPKVTGS